MNISEILIRACQQIGITPPATFNADVNTVNDQLRALVYGVHQYLRSQRIWVQSKRTYTFALAANQEFYPFPLDYYAAILGTQWDTTQKMPLRGPLSDFEFDVCKYGIASFSQFPGFRFFGPDINPASAGGQFQVTPVPTAASDTLSFEYQTKNLFIPPNWVASTAYSSVTPDYVNANGNNYKCTTTGTSSSTTAPTGQSLTPVANGTAAFVYVPQAYETVLQTTDMSMFDDDLVIAGFIAWYWDGKAQPQTEPSRKKFDDMVDNARNRYYGSFRGSMSRYRRGGYRGISPEGGWSL